MLIWEEGGKQTRHPGPRGVKDTSTRPMALYTLFQTAVDDWNTKKTGERKIQLQKKIQQAKKTEKQRNEKKKRREREKEEGCPFVLPSNYSKFTTSIFIILRCSQGTSLYSVYSFHECLL